MRVKASLKKLVAKLRSKNWPDDKIRALLIYVPIEIVDKALEQPE